VEIVDEVNHILGDPPAIKSRTKASAGAKGVSR